MNITAVLQEALGDAFVIERELTGGGMSRVFLAREPRLDRDVVIKTLAPHLAAGVPADRFAREIKLAAGLQHPHIVPVLTAGAAGALLYYVMPHVAGESVAERLELDGPFPVPDAARILRDVAAALAYAHGRGIVHRDIKPANILLSDNHGMVTDFGVAKALRDTAAAETLTGAGFTIGSPAYMAPEQAAGDPATDQRADIYSFGVLAYEMLTGDRPGRQGPQRDQLPAAMADLVMGCLALDPAARPQTAADLVQALSPLAAPAAPTARAGKSLGMPALTLIAVALLVGLTIVIAILRGGTGPAATDPNLVAVLPFRVAGADSSLHYLREGMIDLLAAKLTGEGGPRAADPQSVMSAWRRQGGGDTEDLPQQAALDLATRLGAGEVLTGGVVGSASHVTITASIVTVDNGSVRATANVAGPADSVPALVDQLAGQLLMRTASLDDALATRSIDALRAYLAGRAAYRRGTYDVAAQHLERALKHDSLLTQAALFLVCAQSWGAPVVDIERARRLAWNGRDRLSPRDRARLEALLGPRYPEPILRSETLALTERAVDAARDDPDAWYLFGDAYFHDGAYLGFADHAARARAALERALALDSGFADPLGHLVELAVRRGDTADVRRLAPLYLATEGSRRGGYSLAVRWQIAHVLADSGLAAEVAHTFDTAAAYPGQLPLVALALGAHDHVEGMLASLERRAKTSAEQRGAATLRMTVRLNQGRLREAIALAEAPSGSRASPPLLRIGLALLTDTPDSATAAAVRDVARLAAGPAPDPSNPFALQGYFAAIALLGEWAAASGDAAGVTRAAARMRAASREPGPIARYAGIWAALLDGHAAALRGLPTARGYADEADSVLRLGADLPPPAGENLMLARLYDALRDPVKALAAVRRGSPNGENFLQLFFWREEARLAARAGDRAAALAVYERCVRMVSAPDPEVTAMLETVKREIGVLDQD